MLRAVLRVAVALSALAAAPLARAVEVPPLVGHVVDRAQLLSPARQAALEARLVAFERARGEVVIVHTTPSLEGRSVDEYAAQIAAQWRAGDARLERGVIFTVAPNEHRMRIDAGSGLGATLTAADISRRVGDAARDAFRRGDRAAGVERGIAAILTLLGGERPAAPMFALPSRAELRRSFDGVFFWLLLAAPLAVMMVALGGPRPRRRFGRSAFGHRDLGYVGWGRRFGTQGLVKGRGFGGGASGGW